MPRYPDLVKLCLRKTKSISSRFRVLNMRLFMAVQIDRPAVGL